LKDQIQITVTVEGLRIELLEGAQGTFFKSGSSELNSSAREILVKLAQALGTVPNKVAVEVHTDSKPYPGGAEYSNWELSSDRANSARRLMQENGVRADQVRAVRGYADHQPRKPGNAC
jgi:chemotaxis protein MotB